MKKVLLAIAVVVLTLGLSGCSIEGIALGERIDELELKIDALEVEEEVVIDYYTQEEIDAILLEQAPTRIERWMQSMFLEAMSDGSMEFVDLGQTIVYKVEAYGSSPLFIYEALEPITIQFTVVVDNSLEFCYYPDTMFGEGMECSDLEPTSLFNDGNYIFTIEIPAGFFEFDFESWDDSEDSIVNITISQVVINAE